MSIYEKSIFIGDMHVPFVDSESIAVLLKFMRSFKPNKVFIVGDLIDFYSISSFDKDPNRITSIQSDINIAVELLQSVRSAAKSADILYIEGNHEHRLQKYLWKHPEISSLNALNIRNMLELKDVGIKYVDQYKTEVYHDFIVEHGSLVRQQSAYTARVMLTKRGMSGISGHTHRMGAHYLANMSGNYAWFENGCLCDLHPEYCIGKPDWMSGFSVGYFKGKRFSIEQIPILDGIISYAGKEYK